MRRPFPARAPSASRTLAITTLPQSASAEAALASVVDSAAGLDSVVALASIVDSDLAPSPSIAVLDLGLASIVDSVAGLASVDLVADGKVDAVWPVDCQQDAMWLSKAVTTRHRTSPTCPPGAGAFKRTDGHGSAPSPRFSR